ncbi:MAG: exodeoxyribonuclease VII small subunit [Desulfobacterales bacterium SG8_35]|nr:MAG: exodeoxyribonuclease VII small subunit [Desulfobacterales bacterium SG8_35]
MKEKSFEEALAKLEQITKELEEGNLSLEESLKYFDEGVKLAEHCNNKLNAAQKKVEILLKKNEGLKPAAFEGLDEENA